MDAQYWAGIATGAGWGVTTGLGIALLVALRVKRLSFTSPPSETQSGAVTGSNIVPARSYGG